MSGKRMGEWKVYTFQSTAEPVGPLSAVRLPDMKPTPPGTPVVITLVDGSTISIRFGARPADDDAIGPIGISWTDPDGRNNPSPLIRKIMHGNYGMKWDR